MKAVWEFWGAALLCLFLLLTIGFGLFSLVLWPLYVLPEPWSVVACCVMFVLVVSGFVAAADADERKKRGAA